MATRRAGTGTPRTGSEGALDGIDVLRAALRWVHVIAAVAWVGGSIFYLTVLRPALAASEQGDKRKLVELAINRGFRDAVDLSIIALIVTGVVITFDRVSSAPVTAPYFTILGLKIAAVVGMVFLARDLGTRLGRFGGHGRTPRELVEPSIAEPSVSRKGWHRILSPSRIILLLGLVAFFLSMLLVHVYENDIWGL